MGALRRRLMVAASLGFALVAAGVLPGIAAAGDQSPDYSPKISYELSTPKVGATPTVKFHLEQEDGEDDTGRFTNKIPAGFQLAPDEAIPDGSEIATGETTVHLGPGCNPSTSSLPTVPFNPSTRITEEDRTEEQIDKGVYATWMLRIGTTNIPIEITGSTKKGWELNGTVPSNPIACTPLTLDLEIGPEAPAGEVIYTNPKKPGKYTFSGTYYNEADTASYSYKVPIKITK